ncbi:CidA/LrgA family protein [Vibrio sp. SCSIO 43137]|uniref:CidA/LrgA family protein n=1 Tax=Vibrio sp. SCSIO 43137 TaxID=3021011 RepID=UPI002307CBEA|nr:CidA/LrgA family protein [Vibrio sp. SCSIO 43137]WCE31000.1 CidA/LrgA family protein [Vibrio sp. SCSIO 43137]
MLKTLIVYCRSLAILLSALALGILIQNTLNISIPGSVIGMLLLFFAMAGGLIPAKWVQPSASLFIRYMILMFIPISTGLMEHMDLLTDNALQILASTIGATFITLISLSYLLERLLVGKK